jgi:hypothetical protein
VVAGTVVALAAVVAGGDGVRLSVTSSAINYLIRAIFNGRTSARPASPWSISTGRALTEATPASPDDLASALAFVLRADAFPSNLRGTPQR